VFISSTSRERFADLAAALGTLNLIDRWYQGEGFTRESDVELPEVMMRRALVSAYESRIDWSYEPDNDRVLRVYARAIEDVGLDASGKLLPVTVLLVKPPARRDPLPQFVLALCLGPKAGAYTRTEEGRCQRRR
jgi:hypothetical protein